MTRVAARRRTGGTPSLPAYERQLETFWAAREEALFRHLAGLSPELDLEPIYDEHASLFDRAAVDGLRQAADRAGDAGRHARRLLAFATDGYIERAVAAITDALAAAEAGAVVMWRGQRLPYRTVRSRLSEISNRTERYLLFDALGAADEALNPLRRHRLERVREVAVELGYADYIDLIRVTRGYDPDALVRSARDLLTASETIYYGALRRHLAGIEIEQGDARLPDLWYLLRGIGWEQWFPAGALVATIDDTLAGMGLRLGDQSGATMDLENRPTKSPRAFIAPVRVPGDVRFSVLPQGGWDDYAATLHETGHAGHLLHVDAHLSPGARLLGDRGLAEGYAQAFERIAGHPAWLRGQQQMTEDGAAAFADFFALFWLHHIRNTTALLLAQLRLYRGNDDSVDRADYAGLVGLLTGVTEPESRYLVSVEDGLGVADYLRGVMVDGCLTDALASRHGPAWWQVPQAGDELRDLWRHGLGPSAEDAVAWLGYDHLDWRPVLRQIRAQLIGEMSGYGGPNITTRATSRKV